MAITNQAKQFSQRSKGGAYGPPVAFVASVLIALAGMMVAAVALPKDHALAAVSSLFFAFAALVALVAWRVRQPDQAALTYWDVAGALTLCGICAATLMDSDQLVRLIESQRTHD